jgi:hypothetical protein
VASTPQAATGSDVEESDPLASKLAVTPARVIPVGVSAVHDHVFRRSQCAQLIANPLRGIAVRNVQENDPGWTELADELVDRCRRLQTFAAELVPDLCGGVVADHLVSVLDRSSREVSAHPSESNYSYSHGISLTG